MVIAKRGGLCSAHLKKMMLLFSQLDEIEAIKNRFRRRKATGRIAVIIKTENPVIHTHSVPTQGILHLLAGTDHAYVREKLRQSCRQLRALYSTCRKPILAQLKHIALRQRRQRAVE